MLKIISATLSCQNPTAVGSLYIMNGLTNVWTILETVPSVAPFTSVEFNPPLIITEGQTLRVTSDTAAINATTNLLCYETNA